MLNVVQLGFGGVGQWLVRHYLARSERHQELRYIAIGDRSGLCVLLDGWSASDLQVALDTKGSGEGMRQLSSLFGDRSQFVEPPKDALPSVQLAFSESTRAGDKYVVVDVTAERNAYPTLLEARQLGANIVMCNKWTLAEDMDRFSTFMRVGAGAVRYETTVGAALPVISTMDRLLETGDTIARIEAAISGTMGYICSEIERGTPFSRAVLAAKELGYTEPDPRDDLAGIDARRKALILARKLGLEINMPDVQVRSLVPDDLKQVSVEVFMSQLAKEDAGYARTVADAAQRGQVLRYLATIDRTGASVALVETPLSGVAGTLKGTESLFVFYTRRYGDQPLAVRGRGAGAELTASGVLSDILSLLPERGQA